MAITLGRSCPDDLDVEPAVRAPAGDERRDLALSLPAGNKPRVDRVERDQTRRQLGQLRHASALPDARGRASSPSGTGG